MDVSDASYYIFNEKKEIKVAKWGTPKKYLKKIKTPIATTIQKVHPKRKALQMPRVTQGPTKGINSFQTICYIFN
jgi:hypothetical protein